MDALLIRLGMVLIVLAIGAYGGYEWRDGQAAKEAKTKLEAAAKENDRLTEIAQDLGQALAKEASGRAEERVTWRKQLKEAKHAGTLVSVNCPEPAAGRGAGGESHGAARPVVLLSGEFVRLWDSALFRRGKTADPGRSDEPAGGAGPVEPDEALDNLDENAERWAACRGEVRWWQGFARQAGWVK